MANGYCVGQHKHKIFPSSERLLGVAGLHCEVLKFQTSMYVCVCLYVHVKTAHIVLFIYHPEHFRNNSGILLMGLRVEIML